MATLGNDAKNERRKAERRMKAIQKDIASGNMRSDFAKKRAQEMVKQYRSAIQASRQYAKSGKKYKTHTEASRAAAIERLRELNSKSVKETAKSYSREYMSNEIFSKNINLASSGVKIEGMTKAEARMFFRATQESWERFPKEERLDRILKAYGAKNLEEVWELVFSTGDNALKAEVLQAYYDGKNGDKKKQLFGEKKKLYDEMRAQDAEDAEKSSPESPVVALNTTQVKPVNSPDLSEVSELSEFVAAGEVQNSMK